MKVNPRASGHASRCAFLPVCWALSDIACFRDLACRLIAIGTAIDVATDKAIDAELYSAEVAALLPMFEGYWNN